MADTIMADLSAASVFECDRAVREGARLRLARVIDDDAFDALLDAARIRRAELTGKTDRPRNVSEALGRPAGTRFAPRRVQRSPDRRRSLERKRRIAAAGGLPPNLAHHFTQGQVAVLTVVADQVRERGACDLPLDALAAIAGVSRQWAKVALRIAARLGIIAVEQRPRPGRKHLTNVVTITSREWRAWIARGPRRRIGETKPFPTATVDTNLNRTANGTGRKRAIERAQRGGASALVRDCSRR